MTDAEKCRLIAEFEGENWNAYAEQRIDAAMDYPRDLNATMRAAAKLIETGPILLCVDAGGSAWMNIDHADVEDSRISIPMFPARAAFECIYAYLAERKPVRGV